MHVDPTRPVVHAGGGQLKGHQSAGGGDSGRGHFAEVIQAGGQAGASRITARRDKHR